MNEAMTVAARIRFCSLPPHQARDSGLGKPRQVARGWVSVVTARGDALSVGAGLAFLPPHQARDSGLG